MYGLNGKPITLSTLAHQKGLLKGHPLFGSLGTDKASAVLLTHDGKLPYRALTQREFLEALRQQRPVYLETQSKIEEEIHPMDGYLATAPASELQKVAIPVSVGAHRRFSTEEDDGHQIVIMDDSYFKASLPVHAAQFMVF